MDFKEIQDAELEAVRAIFMEDFEEVESHTVWKSVNAVHEFTLRAYSMEEDTKDAVNLVLHFKLPKTYPKLAPQITLERVHGISATQRTALQELLQSTAKSLLGTEMVYELVTAASTFITENNTVVRFGKLTSLDEDRAKREEELEIQAAHHAATVEQREQLKREAEARKMQAEMEANERKRQQLREERLKADREALPAFAGETSDLALVERFERPLKLPGGLQADILIKGAAISQTDVGTLYHAEAIASSRHGVRLPATLLVVDLYSPYFATPPGQRKLDALGEELAELCDLKHPNLLALYGYQRSPINDMVSQGWRLNIVSEPLPRTSLVSLIEDAGELKVQRALPYWLEISAALEHLHAQDIVHGSLSTKHIHIGRSDTGESLVKVSSAGWHRALLDINRSNRFLETDPPTVPEAWKSPLLVASPLALEKSLDMWDLGIVIAQTLYGSEALSRLSTPGHLLAETRDTAVGQLLASLFEVRPISASKLLSSLRAFSLDSDKNLSLASTRSPARTLFSPGEILPSFALSQAFSPPQQTYLQEQAGLFFQPRPIALVSRYRSEFEEVEKLGQGGFGQVVKARNKLDNNFYAVKKVKLPSDPALETKILREVTIWGRLSHPGVVRYHTSWVETDTTSTDVKQALGQLTSSSTNGTTDTNGTPSSADSESSESGNSEEDEEDSDAETVNRDEEFDMGFDDMDFISTGHQSKSLSMPTIHFGNEDDPSAEPSRVVTRNATPDLKSSTSSLSERLPKQSRTLLIQMEFVSGQTLREQIDDGISEDEMWRLLRQILNAMRYFTSFNIIHRDMKPSNILLDAAGSVRIADFGLAVEQSAPDQLANMSASAIKSDSDLTSGVGTSMYLAPETLDRRKSLDRGGRYTEKIDMYSLGIIIFEMCWPIKTRMERIDILRALRKPEIVFPKGWDESDPVRLRQGKIIRWCLSHDPVKRAGPLDLLRSDLLPAAVQDEYIADTLALIAQPNSPHISTVLSSLFQIKGEDRRAQDLAFDVEVEDSELNNPYDSIVKHKLEKIFQLRGAVDFAPPLLMPSSELYDERTRRPVRLLNRQGVPVQLPYDLVLPLARFVARDDTITRLKRFNISPVYREDRMGGQPRAFLAASYDVVSSHQTLVAEAECIQVVDEILSDIVGNEEFVHVIGHFDFLEAVLETFSTGKRTMARRILERYELLASPWSQVIGEMAKLGLGRKGLDELAALDICGTPNEVQQRVDSLTTALAVRLQAALKDAKKVVDLCQALGVQRKVLVSPLLCFKHEIHIGGICFQSRLQKSRRRDVFAEGGRYDKLVDSLAMAGARQFDRSLVGVTLAVSKLSRAVAARTSVATAKNRSENDKIPRRCEIYVVSYISGLIEARLVIARELWRQGLSADLMYDDDFVKLGADRIAATARKEGIGYLVIVKATNTARDAILKVKDLASNAEREVYRQDLSSYLADKIGEVSAPGTANDPAANPGPALPSVESIDAHLSIPADVMKRIKHKQKRIVLEKAIDSVTEALTASTDIPLFAVDAEGEVFRLMSESSAWICRDDSGQGIRRILEMAPAGRKSYILELRDELKDYHAKHNCRWMWLYSLKDTKANLISFN